VAAGTNYASADGTAQTFTVTVKGTPSAPSISNLPADGQTLGGGFTASVSTTGDGVTSVTSGNAFCTVSGVTVTYAGVGTCSLTAHVATGTDYSANDGVGQYVTISRAVATAPSISNLPADGQTLGGSFTASVSTTGDGVTSVTSGNAFCTVSGVTVTYVGVGTCSLTAHVAAGTNYASADGTAQTFTVTVKGTPSAPSISVPAASGGGGGGGSSTPGFTNAPPPTSATVPASTFGTPTSVSVSSTALSTVTESSSGASVVLTVPANALPAGTIVSVYPVANTAALASEVPSGQSYVVSFAVSWQAPDGTTPTSTAPITMTITDPNIIAGDTIYELTSHGLAAVPSANVTIDAGVSVTISFINDPTFVVTQTILVVQTLLTITTLSGRVGTPLTLAIGGGSGSGTVTFTTSNGTAAGCAISGTSLSSTSAGTCLVTATKAADSTYSAVSSAATAVTFALAAQAAFSVTSTSGTVGTALTLATSGGSGTGAVSFAVVNGTAKGCAISGASLSATSAGTCVVTVTKAADATYSAISPTVTAVAMALPARPGTVTLDFAAKSSALTPGAKRTLVSLSRELLAGASVTVTGFAKGNAKLAKSRASAAVNYLKSSVAVHVTIKTVTSTTANKVTVTTTKQ